MEGSLKALKPWLIIALALVLVVPTLVATACGSTGYKTFSIKEGVQSFNFVLILNFVP